MTQHIRISIQGGLGNQLFQYARGLQLSHIEKKDVVFDISFFNNTRKDTPRPFLLDKFNIDKTYTYTNRPVSFFQRYIKKITQKITGAYEYYQSEKYFRGVKNEIYRQYTLQDPLSQAAQDIASHITTAQTSVSIHIRRGDYVQDQKTHAYHGVCGLEYYKQAIDHIQKHTNSPITFFIYSDDITWVRHNLAVTDAVYVSNPSIADYEELILMSMCQHNIIANSTFSWWAAYLNQHAEKIVIAPKQWTAKKSSSELDILPPTWIQL